ncbi:MAG: response regulator [Dongiaceae bacterium]
MSEPDSRRRILVVEDELLIALDLAAMIGELGHEVVGPVARVAQAIGLAKRERLDAAILDVQLRGGERSYPVADWLISHGVPVVFCTAYGDEGLDAAYAACSLLRKPFANAQVGAALARVLPGGRAGGGENPPPIVR